MKIHTTLVWFCAGHYEATVENLFSPYFRLLEKEVETDHNTVFMDDTKLESRTGRYTFYWWKSEAQRGENSGYPAASLPMVYLSR